MRSVFLIGGSLAGMFFGEIYPAIIFALIFHNLGISTNKANHTWRKFKAKPQEHYDVLEANPAMSINDIRKKYIEMAKFYHPDRYRHRTLSEQKFANEKMQRLNEAWNKVVREKKI